MISRDYFLVVCLFVFSLWIIGCDAPPSVTEESGNTQQEVNQQHVETLILNPTTFEDVIERTGTVAAIHDATLSAQSSGTVEMLLPLGQYAEQGTIIARLEQNILQAALEQIEAQLANARAAQELADDNYARQAPLYRDSIISALEFQSVRAQQQQARASVRQAEAALSQAQKQFDNTTIRAPFSGRIEEHLIEEGEQVSPGMAILRIVDTRRVKISVGIPERYAGDIEQGTEIHFNMIAYPNDRWTGRVTFAGNTINPSNRTFPIEAMMNNPDGRLKPEMIAQVFISRQQLDSVLVIPRSAIVTTETGDNVFVIATQDQRQYATLQPITLGPAYERLVVVTQGLTANQEIIIRGQTTLTEGVSVAIDAIYTRLDNQGIPIP